MATSARPGRRAVVPVAEFVEKPDAARAAAFVQSGEYLWNSGMFLFSARRYLEELARLAPAIREACRSLWPARRATSTSRGCRGRLFAACPSDSIDYAVMEKTDAAAVIPLDAGWSDVGSWASLQDALPATAERNVCHGDVLLHDVRNCLLLFLQRPAGGRRGPERTTWSSRPRTPCSWRPRDRVQDVKSWSSG
jgi:mannose-1-phosphate guanylyltransferase / mannose-6-phosphate isomerase